jgi:AcrR family transcriptional regulator
VTSAELKVENGWDRRRSRVAAHIEKVALDAFAASGYANVTVADVATASGISARTVARYFPSKEDLLLAFPRRMSEDAREGLATLKGSDDPVSGVWELWKQQAQSNAAELPAFLSWIRALQTAPEIGARVPGEQRREIADVIVELCAEALGVDAVRDLRPVLLANTLMAANEAVCNFWMATGATSDLVALFDDARNALMTDLATLHAPTSAARKRPRKRNPKR